MTATPVSLSFHHITSRCPQWGTLRQQMRGGVKSTLTGSAYTTVRSPAEFSASTVTCSSDDWTSSSDSVRPWLSAPTAVKSCSWTPPGGSKEKHSWTPPGGSTEKHSWTPPGGSKEKHSWTPPGGSMDKTQLDYNNTTGFDLYWLATKQ